MRISIGHLLETQAREKALVRVKAIQLLVVVIARIADPVCPKCTS